VGLLFDWRFCPRCGASLEHLEGRVECGSCGFVRYANSLPAVSVLVVDAHDRLLLARRAVEPAAGLWDTIGGFLEEDEDALAGLRREVLEETGLEVEPSVFVGAYTDRYGEGDAAPWALNLVWEARIVRGEPKPADDVSELRWFQRDELPAREDLAFEWLSKAFADWTEKGR
jgi:ADP-ribose pyrophosphatase YjhB (NUDIX family)